MENLNNELYTHPIAIYKLNKNERNILAKLKKSGIYTNRALDIISLDDEKLDEYKDLIFKDPSIKPLIVNLKDKIINTPGCIRKFIAPISFSSMQRELIEVLDYIKTFKKKEQDLFNAFVYDNESIENYAAKNNSKESIILKHKNNIFKELRTVLFYNTSKYKNYLKNNSSLDIRLEMPELYSMIQGESFYTFIKNIFDFEDSYKFGASSIDNIDITECFNNIFQEIELPCPINTFRNSFYEIEGLNYSQINTLMPQIEAQGLIEVKDKKVVSAKLQFKTAVIQVLLQEHSELSFDDILKEIKLKHLYDGKPQSQEDFENSLGLYDSVIKASKDSFIHIKNSNLTIDTIDNVINFIETEKEKNPNISIGDLKDKIKMPISVFELEHICNKIA